MGLPGLGKPWANAFDSCRHAHAAKADVIRRNEKIMTSLLDLSSPLLTPNGLFGDEFILDGRLGL
jgi:hypothetical protein